MSEMVDKKRKGKADETVPVETGPIEIEGMEEFNPEEITRLLKVKAPSRSLSVSWVAH
jgi:hypothetical protein